MYFRQNYKFVKRDRVFPKSCEQSSDSGISSAGSSLGSSASGSKPLADMKFVIAGTLGKSKSEITKAIQVLGGKVSTKADGKTAACISTKG